MSRIVRIAALAILGASALTGCGHRTSLERPAPMWGEARERYEAEERAREEEERARQEAERAAAEQQAPEPTTPLSPPPPPAPQ